MANFVVLALAVHPSAALDPSPYLSFGLSGGAGLGLLVLFWKVQSGVIGEKDKEYDRVKAERDEAIADHHSCEELVDRLVGALRKAGISVPWTWKLTPPGEAYLPPKEGRHHDADDNGRHS